MFLPMDCCKKKKIIPVVTRIAFVNRKACLVLDDIINMILSNEKLSLFKNVYNFHTILINKKKKKKKK